MRRSCGRLEEVDQGLGIAMCRCGMTAVLAAAIFVVCLLVPNSAGAEIVVTVDKAKQRMFVEVDGEQRHEWLVSTGLGNTPSGSYRPQFLARHHRSSLFNNAPMPYSIF